MQNPEAETEEIDSDSDEEDYEILPDEFDIDEIQAEFDEHDLDFSFPKRLPCAAHCVENALLFAFKEGIAKDCVQILRNLIGRFNKNTEAKNELKNINWQV